MSRTYTNETTVYSLADPRTGRTRYVGRAKKPQERLRAHLRRPHSRLLQEWVAELQALGMKPEFRLLEGATEREWILRLRPDLNVNRGDDQGENSVIFVVRLSPGERAALEAKMRIGGFRTLSGAVRAAILAWDPR